MLKFLALLLFFLLISSCRHDEKSIRLIGDFAVPPENKMTLDSLTLNTFKGLHDSISYTGEVVEISFAEASGPAERGE